MRRERMGAHRGIIAAALSLAVLPALAGGGVWVSNDGTRHEVHGRTLLVGESGDGKVFDVAELADGETRVFGTGVKQIVASRRGDLVTLTRESEAGRHPGLDLECRVDADTCQVITFEDDPDRVLVMAEKVRRCDNGVGDCDEDPVRFGERGTAVFVEKRVDCGDTESCGDIVHLTDDSGADATAFLRHFDGHGMAFIRIDGDLHTMFGEEGVETHDLSELLDGETRIFGSGERQVTAIRTGDEVRLIQEATDEYKGLDDTCVLGRDTCRVLTIEGDPERLILVLAKTGSCAEGESCREINLRFGLGGAADVDVLHFDRDERVIVIDGDTDGASERRMLRRIRVADDEI